MFGLGAGEILVIGILALIFIGPKKLPELARGLGKGLREFQKAKDDLLDDGHQASAPKLDNNKPTVEVQPKPVAPAASDDKKDA